ncbi:MAG TPA: aldo/keto reductase [Longilinea sp.]|nr:aldo/keto reductase [Longilinea sp.]
MKTDTGARPALASGTFRIGGDMSVVRMGFGAMRITGPGIWGEPRDRNEAVKVLRRALELGVNFIDTADSYGPYVSEELIKAALHPYPKDLVIATKAGKVRTGPGEWFEVGRPEYLRQEVEMSLRRLGQERIDLFQLHSIDVHVPLADQVGAALDMQTHGKVRHIGLSNVTVDQIKEARKIAKIVSVQNRYNLADRESEAVLEYCEKEGLAFIPWSPVARGTLTENDGALAKVAQELEATPTQVALAWLLRRSPVMLPIPGTASLAHLEENVAAAGYQLTDAQFSALAEAA